MLGLMSFALFFHIPTRLQALCLAVETALSCLATVSLSQVSLDQMLNRFTYTALGLH